MSDTIGADPQGFAHILVGSGAGVVLRAITCPWEMREHQPVGDDEIAVLCEREVADAAMKEPSLFRIIDGYCVPRAPMAPVVSTMSFPADGVSECTVSGLPDPCGVRLSGAVAVPWTEVSGGAVTITSTTPGRIVLSVRAPPSHAPWTADFDAV